MMGDEDTPVSAIVVTGTYMPASVAASIYECGKRIVILHVPRHVSMIRACMQHAELLKDADITLRTHGLDILPGRYEILDLGDHDGTRMATFTARTGAVHRTTPTDDIGHVMMNARAIAAMGPRVGRVVGEAPPRTATP